MIRLKSLSDRELISRLRTLVKKEQDLTLEIVPHLVEVLRRGIYLAQGYGSLYEYCKGELGYTDASAWRRARAAQAIVRCPAAWDSLASGAVNLCTLGRVHRFITPAVLREITGKSKAEVELIAAAYDTKGALPDRTRPIMIPKASPVRSANTPADVPGNQRLRSEVSVANRPGTPPLRGEVARKNKTPIPSFRSEPEEAANIEFEQKWKIEGVVSKEVKAKLDRCKSLLSRKYPQGVDYDILLGELAETFLDRKDPEREQDRRMKRQAAAENRPRPARRAKPAPKFDTPPHRPQPAVKPAPKHASALPRSRHIPAREKAKAWTRDAGRCTYIGSNGKRCNSTYNLQFDHHPVPFARGGPGNAANLRLLCAKHNKHTAEKTFGPHVYDSTPT